MILLPTLKSPNKSGNKPRRRASRAAERLCPSLCLLALLFAFGSREASAVSCTTQSQMTASDRQALAAAAQQLAGYAAAGDTTSLRSATLPSVAAQFEGIASTVETLAPRLKTASLSVQNLYLLHAEDLKTENEDVQFFCSVPGSPLLVSLSIPDLPPGVYALAILHADGVAQPQQMGMILTRKPGANGSWQLAGFFARPLSISGHDGVWYWTRARELAKSQQRWSAYFYYESAQYLLTPVDFLASPNLTKLEREAAAVRPDGLPSGEGATATGQSSGGQSTGPMTLSNGDQSFAITSLRTDGSLGGLDLLIHYNANAGNVDPVFARAQAVLLMQAMLKQHPELRASFHGLWVYADSPGHQAYAIELPMDQIQ